MLEIETALGFIAGEHRQALEWFQRHAGTEQPWSVISEHADNGPRLVTQAKGIYKPRYTECALSVRQTLDSPYADLEVERRSDGSWVYPYYQEGQDPAQRDEMYTNQGLMKCMQDYVPVGVLIQRTPKPGVTYDVLGLAIVSEWRDGYFVLEGFSNDGHARTDADDKDAGHLRAIVQAQGRADFEPGQAKDTRNKILAEVTRRRGQPKFRKQLIAAYAGQCAISGCNAVEALEAAHITPYRGEASHHPQNGLLLRADLHSLFDMGLIAIDSGSMKVRVASGLASTEYGQFAGQTIVVPADEQWRPSQAALEQHRLWSGL